MDAVRRDILGRSHDRPPAAVIANKMKLRSLTSSDLIHEKGNGSYRGFDYVQPGVLVSSSKISR